MTPEQENDDEGLSRNGRQEPRTGLPDICSVELTVDELLARRAAVGRKEFIMQEIGAAVDKLLEAVGDA